jgi:hypothetical protein
VDRGRRRGIVGRLRGLSARATVVPSRNSLIQ